METPKYNYPVSLIPGGCPQFLDYAFDLNAPENKGIKFNRIFKEEKKDQQGETGARGNYMLRCLEEDARGQWLDQLSGEPSPSYDYEVEARKCLDLFLEQWIPLPMFRVKEMKRPDKSPMFEAGPSNWCRCRLVRTGENGSMLRMVVVLDTTVEEPPLNGDTYFALSPSDVAANAVYGLAWHVRDNTWFLNAPWVDRWLFALYEGARKKGSREEGGYVMQYLANYLTLLELLHRLLPDIKLKVINPDRDNPLDVDLIIDIGNARTTGILVETLPQRFTDLNNSYLLQIRDLSAPENIYTEPFATRVEFSEATFGDDAYSKLSGRKTPAFVWPSAVRMGREAARLATLSRGAEGSTGMSSPKRYLWDERLWKPTWRFNTGGGFEPMVTRGSFAQQVNHMGTPLACFDDPAIAGKALYRNQEREMAFESQFTRSSLMMFLMAEVIIHTLVTINSPAQRARRELSDLPRRLRRIVFTVPPAMPKAEQLIYRRWVRFAVRTVWSAIGWEKWYVGDKGGRQAGLSDYRQNPECHCNWDEASCTHLVYLYNEVSHKFQGDAHFFFKQMGSRRENYGPYPSLRVASIDVGGGTTDLSIATYTLDNDESSSARIRPHPELRDGFNLAGDDILKAVISEHLLPAIGKAAANFGVLNVRNFLNTCFGRNVVDSSQEQRNLRSQFARQIAGPAGQILLGIYERGGPFMHTQTQYVLGDFFDGHNGQTLSGKRAAAMGFSPAPTPGQAVINYVQKEANKAALANPDKAPDTEFSLMEAIIPLDMAAIERTIKEVMGRVLADLCEVIHLYNCDVVLLTGRPSQLNGIIASVVAKLPVPADRVIPMCDYRVGHWYPFVDAAGNISDPKTTVSMGAILCALSEGHLPGFSFVTKELKLGSTARYIGEMNQDSQITKSKEWFTVDVESGAEQELTHSVVFNGPLTVGFRQFPIERWPTTRFYLMDFASEEDRRLAASKGTLPYTVNVGFIIKEVDAQAINQEYDEGSLFVVDVQDNQGATPRGGKRAIELRLQTMPLDEGYWLDSGVLFN